MTSRKWMVLIFITIATLLTLSAATIARPQLQGPDAQEPLAEPGESTGAYSDLANGFYYQGVLTENGIPVNGTRDMEFKLYDAGSGGSQVGSTLSQSVPVSNGQFNVELTWGRDNIDGKALWLQVRAKDGGGVWRNLGRTQIRAVPYAMSLKPGAWVRAQNRVIPYALFLSHLDPAGGDGLRVSSEGGASIYATGTGIIKSSAESHVWISGNNLRKKYSNDSTQLEMDIYGGAIVKRGDTAGNKDVMIPVTLPGPLYGQNVKVTGIDIYFKSQGDFDGIGVTAIRRQTAAGAGNLIVRNTTPRVCVTACSYHLDLTQNNVLSADQGALYIALQLFFGGANNYVQIGGVRLTLEHE